MKKQNGFQRVVSKILNMDSVSYIASPFGFQGDDAIDQQLAVTYQNSLYISRAIEAIQDAVGNIDFDLYRITKTDGTREEVVTHPLIDLLYKPNPLQTKSEFWRILVVNFKLSGEAFVQIIRDKRTKQPVMLLNLNPKDIQVELTDLGEVKYKHTNLKGEIVNFTSEDIFHIKNPNPNSQLRGFSALRPLLSRVDAEIKATEYQASLFGRNGNPDGVLAVKGVTVAEKLTAIKNAFYNSFRGKNESNRVAVIGGEATYTPLNSNGNVLDFIASKNNVRDEVFMALGVPKSLVTSDDVNRANADAGLQQFMQFTIAPMFMLFMEVINERFVIPNYGEEYCLDTEKLVTEDKDQLLKEAQAGVNKWLTVNEVRERFGYDAIDGGDVMQQPAVFQFNPANAPADGGTQGNKFGKAVFKSRPNHYKKLKHMEAFGLFLKKKAFLKVAGDPVYKLKFSSAVNSIRDKGESKLKKESKAFFMEQKARVLKKLEEVGADHVTTAGDLFDVNAEKRNAMNMILPIYTSITVQAGNVSLTPLTMVTGKANNFVMNSVLYKQLEQRASFFSNSVNDTTYQKISAIVADNMSGGIDDIKSALEDEFDTMSGSRAERIARTEAGFMTSLGSDMAYQQSDVVDGKEWLTTGDDRVREEHVQNDGEIVGKYDAFSNGEHFPAESSINCRCTIAPVVSI